MSVQMEKSLGSVRAVIEPDDPVVYVAHSIMSGAEWFLLHGLTTFDMKWWRGNNRCFVLVMTARGTPRKMEFSSFTPVSVLNEKGFFPDNVSRRWQTDPPNAVQMKFDKVEGNDWLALGTPTGGTVVEIPDLRPDLTVNEFAYGISETVMGFFVRGVTRAAQQCSMKCSQIWVELGMGPQELREYENQSGYLEDMKVKDVPDVYLPSPTKSTRMPGV